MLLEEFDFDKSAVIEPWFVHQPVENFPEVTVSCFSHGLFEKLLAFFEPEVIAHVRGGINGASPVYGVEYRGMRFAFYQSYVGEPKCINDYEELIAMGSKRLILFGSCGVLDKNITDCSIIIPTRALRDEGCSYHYAPPADAIEVNTKYREEFRQVLSELGYSYVEGTTWTTDAPYRETREKVNRRREQGAVCVEMECAGMQALCNFRNTEFFQFFYAADNLDHPQWDRRSLSGLDKLDDKTKIGLLAFELGLKIVKNV